CRSRPVRMGRSGVRRRSGCGTWSRVVAAPSRRRQRAGPYRGSGRLDRDAARRRLVGPGRPGSDRRHRAALARRDPAGGARPPRPQRSGCAPHRAPHLCRRSRRPDGRSRRRRLDPRCDEGGAGTGGPARCPRPDDPAAGRPSPRGRRQSRWAPHHRQGDRCRDRCRGGGNVRPPALVPGSILDPGRPVGPDCRLWLVPPRLLGPLPARPADSAPSPLAAGDATVTPAPFFAGALCAFGLFIAVRSLRTVRPADAPVGTTDPGPSGTAASWPSNPVGRIGSMARRGSMALGLDPGRRCSGDLAVTGRSPEDHAARALIAGTWLAALVLLVTAALHSAGAAIGGPVVLGGAAVAFLAGPFMAELALRSEANGRREDLRVDLGAFAELMVLLLAAGSGVEGALAHAAEAGDDWTWRQLRNALRAARLTRRSSAEALSSLGRELEVTELEELG